MKMNIYIGNPFNVFPQKAAFLFKENIPFSLTSKQKQIGTLVLLAFGCLAVCFALGRKCLSFKKIKNLEGVSEANNKKNELTKRKIAEMNKNVLETKNKNSDLKIQHQVSDQVNDIWKGDKYHQNSAQQQMVAEMLIKQHPFNPHDVILDVGCGDGKITKEISKKIPEGKIWGIDPSPSMIDFANENSKNQNTQFLLGKASELSFQNQFDLIVSFSALHWEPKQYEALICFKKALKPGGKILLAIPGPDPIIRLVLTELIQSSKWAPFFKDYKPTGRIWTANEYAQLLLDAKFTIQKIELVERPYLFKNPILYKAFIAAMLPHMSCIPLQQQEDFLNDILTEIKNHGLIDESNRVKFEVKVLEVIAQSPID